MSTINHDFDLSMMRYPRQLEEREGRVLSALTAYQIIETILKAFLVQHYQKKAADVLHLPLSHLLKKFAADNKNLALQNALKSINSDRNLVAHQALVFHNFGLSALLGAQELDLADLKHIEKKATKVMSDLVCEFIKQTKPL